MKKIILLVFIIVFTVTTKGYCDVTYSAKSTVHQSNAQEVIKLDVLPVIKINHTDVPTSVDNPSTYVAPLIAPAQQDKPVLNFNLNNIKNIKKGAIFPNDNVNQTVSSVAQYFNAPYDKVFSHLLGIVDNSELEVISYDSESGRIFANYNHEKPIYITVSKYNSANVLVKVTPADGIYNIPASVTNKIFDELNRSITTK